MAYASWSVTFGEQPSASKWNILGTNDAYFATIVGTAGVFNVGSDGFHRINGFRSKAISTSTTNSNVMIQSGWDFIQGNGSAPISKAITFPTAYTSTPFMVIINSIGEKTSSDPTALSDFSTVVGGDASVFSSQANGWATTGFTAYISAVSGQSLSATNRYGFTWIAFGVKT